MANTTIYLIDSTDGKTTFAIQPKTFDGFGGVQQHTDLTLYGNATSNWGERFNENFYKSLENFATYHNLQADDNNPIFSPTAISAQIPKNETELFGAGLGINNPTEGQLWYNKTDGKVYVYSIATPSTARPTPTQVPTWRPVGAASTSQSAERVTGELWYDADNTTLNVFDDSIPGWVPISGGSVGSFVQLDGANTPMTGFLTLNADPIDPLHAATKQWVEAVISGVVIGDFVEIIGDTMTGFLTLNADPIDPLHAATKQWVESHTTNNFVELIGDTMTGFLTLNADPTLNLHAATKQYVDTEIAASPTNVSVSSIIPFPTDTVPTGYLQCDGSTISRTTYADLFAVLGISYGIGDGSTTFGIPDLRGEFVRGWDDARGIDAGRVIGSFQDDAFESHSHPSAALDSVSIHFAASGGLNVANDGSATGLSGGIETRPRNIAMQYCIKY